MYISLVVLYSRVKKKVITKLSEVLLKTKYTVTVSIGI